MTTLRGHRQKFSPSQISSTPWIRFDPELNLSSGIDEWSCAAMITATLRRHSIWVYEFMVHWYLSSPPYDGLFCVFPCYENLIEKAMDFLCKKAYMRWRSDGRKLLILWESMAINFPDSPHRMGFATYSHAMEYWRKYSSFPMVWSIP